MARSPVLPLLPADEAARPAALLGSGVEDYLGVFDDDEEEEDNENRAPSSSSSFSSQLPALPLGRGLAAPLLPRRAREAADEGGQEWKENDRALLRHPLLPPGAKALRRALLHASQARAEGGGGEACSENGNSCAEASRAALEALVASGGPVA